MVTSRGNELIGERIFLRDQTLEDAARVTANFKDPELIAVDPPIGEVHGQKPYSIVTNDGIHIGVTSAYNFRGVDVELGIRIWNRDYWDKGYGTEALNLLTEWVFKASSVEGIIVKLVESNTRAIKCYKKCGFTEYARGSLEGYSMIWMKKLRSTGNESNTRR